MSLESRPTGTALKDDEEEENEGCVLVSGTDDEMAARGG